MESRPFFLKATRRRERRNLIHFLQGLSLLVTAGYDLSFAWPEAIQMVRGDLDEDWVDELHWSGEPGLAAHLDTLSVCYRDQRHRPWFGVLKDLYIQGGGLGEAISAVADTLRDEQKRDLDGHLRELPIRLNLLILLFFLPPSLLLLFVPLLLSLDY
jgi:hypothetical protein